MVAMATNDLAEQLCGLLTHQIENFTIIRFRNATGTAQA